MNADKAMLCLGVTCVIACATAYLLPRKSEAACRSAPVGGAALYTIRLPDGKTLGMERIEVNHATRVVTISENVTLFCNGYEAYTLTTRP